MQRNGSNEQAKLQPEDVENWVTRFARAVESGLAILNQFEPHQVSYLRSRGNPIEFMPCTKGRRGYTEEQEAHWQSLKAAWRLWPEHYSVWNVLGGNWILDVLCWIWPTPGRAPGNPAVYLDRTYARDTAELKFSRIRNEP